MVLIPQFQLLAGNPLRYRRQMLALKHFFAGRGCTVLLLDDLTTADRNLQVQSIAHGVIRLEQLTPEYGAHRRRLRVLKYRGVNFRGGYHDYVIVRGGLDVFPRLVAAEFRQPGVQERLASGLSELDKLLGGGLERVRAPSAGGFGTGKSTLFASLQPLLPATTCVVHLQSERRPRSTSAAPRQNQLRKNMDADHIGTADRSRSSPGNLPTLFATH